MKYFFTAAKKNSSQFLIFATVDIAITHSRNLQVLAGSYSNQMFLGLC